MPEPVKEWTARGMTCQLYQPGLDGYHTSVRLLKDGVCVRSIHGSEDFCRLMLKGSLTQLST